MQHEGQYSVDVWGPFHIGCKTLKLKIASPDISTAQHPSPAQKPFDMATIMQKAKYLTGSLDDALYVLYELALEFSVNQKSPVTRGGM